MVVTCTLAGWSINSIECIVLLCVTAFTRCVIKWENTITVTLCTAEICQCILYTILFALTVVNFGRCEAVPCKVDVIFCIFWSEFISSNTCIVSSCTERERWLINIGNFCIINFCIIIFSGWKCLSIKVRSLDTICNLKIALAVKPVVHKTL